MKRIQYHSHGGPQALMPGAEWVARQTDVALTAAVRNAMAKIDGVTSPSMRPSRDEPPSKSQPPLDRPRQVSIWGSIGGRFGSSASYGSLGAMTTEPSVSARSGRPSWVSTRRNEASAGWCERDQRYRLFDEPES